MAKDALRFLDTSPHMPAITHDILDKPTGIRQYVAYMLDRTNAMFEYQNLPDTIPAYLLELYLQIFGVAAVTEIKQSDLTGTTPCKPGLHIFYDGAGGEHDIYFRPTTFIVSNPSLRNSLTKTILYSDTIDIPVTNPIILIPNDTNYVGLLPLYNRYAAQMVENDISIRSAQINTRAQIGITVSTDRDKDSALKYFSDLEAGKLGIVGETAFLEGIQSLDLQHTTANLIIQLIELQQYLKASWYNELGLNSNANMKREYISNDEVENSSDMLLPLVDDMLKSRQQALENINKIFGTNISVDKSSAWKLKEEEAHKTAEKIAEGGDDNDTSSNKSADN